MRYGKSSEFLRHQTAEARRLDRAIARNLKELGYEP